MSMKFALPFLLTPIAAFANQAQDIERITVSTTRSTAPVSTVPATISVITSEDIAEQLAHTQDLSQILGNLLPSFSPSRQKMTSAGETLRGREPLYMIDGVPQSNPLRNGSRDGNTIDPAMIERIEVISGANAIQGMGASGGIINIITKSAGDFNHQMSAGFSTPTDGGSDSQSYKASYLFSQQLDDISFIGGVSARSTGMYRDGNGDFVGLDGTQGDTQDSTSLDLFLKVKYQLDNEQSIQAMLNHYKIEGNGDFVAVNGDPATGLATSAEKGDVEGDTPRNRVTTFTLDYNHSNVAGGNLAIQLFTQDFAAMYGGGTFATFQDPAYGETIFDQSQNKSQKFGSRVTYNKDNLLNSQFDIATGIDLLSDETYQELAQTGRHWVPKTKFNNIAPFAQLRYDGLEDWTFNAGVRYEYGKLKVDDFTTLASYNSSFVEGGEPSFNELLENLGVVYQVTDELRLYASYSEGFSMADVGRVLRGINQAGLSVESFLNLEPVISDNRELGFEYANDSFNIKASYFESDSDLGSRLQADADGIYSVQRERTEISGFEANAQYYLTNSTTFGASYADTEGQYDGDGDNKVESDLGGSNISPTRLNLYWQQQWPANLSSRVQANKIFDRDFNTGEEFDGYTTVDLSVQYQSVEYGAFSLGIDNLLDKYYITYYGQTRPAATRYFAGTGRTVNLTWNYAF
ncbi:MULTISPECIES: TonB-dependent receptor [Pseudoalteromonas]|uniref:TonB-dependent receptor n=1 Tax=Pseudoalteromonas TaxID=53246 RepID=UPI00272A720A|nr:TonB-dependent receptor [Pseudoalteromonas sp.]